MKQKKLNRLCREWQETLSLRDWDVSVGVVRAHEMSREGKAAEVFINEQKMDANICLRDPCDVPTGKVTPDVEISIVHELLHLRYIRNRPEDDDTARFMEMEQFINTVSVALVVLKRRKKISRRD